MIESVDHWVAFALLSVIGGKMIRDGLQGGADPDPAADPATIALATEARRGPLHMVMTAIGTSIDSAVVGVTLALVGVSVTLAAPLIGVTSFTMSLIGVLLGRKLGPLLGRKAEVLGGIALILIGTHILFDHLGAG
jgi:putative Mn2+ efflux pump MntP